MKNLIGFWPNLSRAYETALLGDFTIQIIFDKEYLEGFADYKEIKLFYNDIEFLKDGDLIVEIHKPDYSKNTELNEKMANIHFRVQNAKNNIKPTEFKNDSCDVLLKTATDRLSFSLSKREKVIEISKIIAQLDGSELIYPQHIAEAIQYNCHEYENYCNAEAKTINFGEGIEISLYELNCIDIENAITYLKETLKS